MAEEKPGSRKMVVLNELRPGNGDDFFIQEPDGCPGVNQNPGDGVGMLLHKKPKGVRVAMRWRGGGFDFNGQKATAVFENKIHFPSIGHLPKEKSAPGREEVCKNVQMKKDHAFQERSHSGTLDGGRVKMTGKKSRQARVEPVNFGRFDQTLCSVSAKRRKSSHQMGRFQQVDVPMHARLGKARVAGQTGLVENGRVAKGKELHQAAEIRERIDVRQVSEVPFQVGRNVPLPPARDRGLGEGEHGRQEPSPQNGSNVGGKWKRAFARESARQKVGQGKSWRARVPFPLSERAQGEIDGSTRQAFTDAPHQEKVGRSGKEKPRFFSIGINGALDAGQQGGRLLHFVQDDARGPCPKRGGVPFGLAQGIVVVKGHISGVGHFPAQEGAFPGLARARQDDHRVVAQSVSDRRIDPTRFIGFIR